MQPAARLREKSLAGFQYSRQARSIGQFHDHFGTDPVTRAGGCLRFQFQPVIAAHRAVVAQKRQHRGVARRQPDIEVAVAIPVHRRQRPPVALALKSARRAGRRKTQLLSAEVQKADIPLVAAQRIPALDEVIHLEHRFPIGTFAGIGSRDIFRVQR
jgi:hypothetical protein